MTKQQSLLDHADRERVIDVDIAERMEQSFLDYSMSVIVGRALPDVRDGLKPVQRRILFAMWEAGLRPDRPYRKCASAVGDVMKKYHPHGDSSIYDALVRMAQEFSSREPLVDGHGNFGSIDGDSPAAMRYTEARLSLLAMEMLAGIDENTVDFVPNYDGYEQEPVVLPARFPNLLVNGATGIAVGMATNIPPHNLGEVIDACLLLIKKPTAKVEDLMKLVPAPDFPTGARILSTDGIRDAYLTGRGAITMEAVASTETRSGGLPRIVITEIPFQVNKAALLERIADLVKEKKVESIRDLRDESSREGMRVVIELKRGEDPARVLRTLYRLTDLRTNFNVNVVALVNGQPRTLGLRDALVEYVGHQRVVLTRRTTFRKEKAEARAHILEGLLLALDNLDAVIKLIRAAPSADKAREQLMSTFKLTEIQATAILDMQLRRLAKLERDKVKAEHTELKALIKELKAILADQAKLDAMLTAELKALKAAHANPRRSRLVAGAAEPSADEDAAAAKAGDRSSGELLVDDDLPELEAQPVTLYVTRGGYLKSVPRRKASKPHTQPNDPVVAVLRATTEDTVLLIDSDGGGYRIGVGDIPVTTLRQRGTSIAQLLGDSADTTIAGALLLTSEVETVLTVSARGLVKRTERSEFEGRLRTMIAAGVKDDDAIVAALACRETDHVLLAHSGGLVIRFAAEEARPMGRAAAGVAGMSVPKGERVVSATVAPGDDDQAWVLTVDTDGGAKRTALGEYPAKGRGGKGLQTGAGSLAFCGVGGDLHVPAAGEPVLLEVERLPQAKRPAKCAPMTAAVQGPAVAESGRLQ